MGPAQSLLLAGLNHLLAGASWARARLAPFAGRSAVLVLPPFQFALAIDGEGMFAAGDDAPAPDVTIRLPADTPLKLPLGLDKIMAEAHVEGNAEFATELSFVFRNLRWDIEEDLSRLVGDIAAHRLVQTADRVVAWQRQAATRFADNCAEYLRHENPLLLGQDEFADFRAAITRLNADLGELEKRVARA